jgi:hypothetical protein
MKTAEMRGAPQSTFLRLICRIKARSSALTGGPLPAPAIYPAPVTTQASPMPAHDWGRTIAITLRTDGNNRYGRMKNRRSPITNWIRPRTFRCNTTNCCRSAAFSASGRLVDLSGEINRLRKSDSSATIPGDANVAERPLPTLMYKIGWQLPRNALRQFPRCTLLNTLRQHR